VCFNWQKNAADLAHTHTLPMITDYTVFRNSKYPHCDSVYARDETIGIRYIYHSTFATLPPQYYVHISARHAQQVGYQVYLRYWVYVIYTYNTRYTCRLHCYSQLFIVYKNICCENVQYTRYVILYIYM